MIHYPVKLELRIDWSEMDLFGHVNNVSYFKYVQASRVNYWEKTGVIDEHMKEGIGPMLVSCKCDFKAPLHYPGSFIIEAGVAQVGNTSFTIRHRIIDSTGKLCAEAEDVIVMFNYKNNEKVRVPDDLRSSIDRIQQSLSGN